MLSVETDEQLAAWLAQRRANFPSKANIDAKLAAAKTENAEASKENANESALEKKAEKLRKQLLKVESSIKRKREQQDEGDDMRQSDMSSVSDIKSEDDEKPETMSTRQEPPSLPPPPKKADPTRQCKYYSTGGTCGKRGKCRFVHDPAIREAALREQEMNGGRLTLNQRLILNDKEEQDYGIIQALKYLQDKKKLDTFTKRAHAASSSGAAASNAQHDSKPSSQVHVKKDSTNGLPPIPPPSVVPGQAGDKYAGWNLSGYTA